MDNSALGNNKNNLPWLSITWQQIAKMSSVAALTHSHVSLQLIGQYRMKALMALGKIIADRENNKQYRFSPRNSIGKQCKIVFVISHGRIVHI